MLKAILAAALVGLPSAVAAQWVHEASGGAFDGAPLQIAATQSRGYTFGFRCRDADDLEMIYITTEIMTERDALELNTLRPVLLVRIDDNAVREMPAAVDVAGAFAGFMVAVPEGLAAELAGATHRVAVAARILGDLYHEHEFMVVGSAQAIGAAFEGCEIPLR